MLTSEQIQRIQIVGPLNFEEAQFVHAQVASSTHRMLLSTTAVEFNHWHEALVQWTRWVPSCIGYFQEEVARLQNELPSITVARAHFSPEELKKLFGVE
jgi:hypothetical protein